MKPGVYAKDIILYAISRLGVAGATDKVIEFRGPVVDAMSMEGRMTLCNMAVEAGGTSGVCMPDSTTVDYLWPFIGPAGEQLYASKKEALEDYAKWRSDDDAAYSSTLSIDCSLIEPLVTVGFKPDQVALAKEMSGVKVDQVYIGSCTNGRIEDLRAAAAVLKGRKIASDVRGIVSPRDASGICPGAERRTHRNIYGRGILRDQSHLWSLPRHVQWCFGRRGSLRLHYEQKF